MDKNIIEYKSAIKSEEILPFVTQTDLRVLSEVSQADKYHDFIYMCKLENEQNSNTEQTGEREKRMSEMVIWAMVM